MPTTFTPEMRRALEEAGEQPLEITDPEGGQGLTLIINFKGDGHT